MDLYTTLRDHYIALSYWLDPFFLVYFAVINIAYCILLFFGSIGIYQRHRGLEFESIQPVLKSNSLPEITFLMAAYNESVSIIQSIDNLISLSYRYKQIIVINDGSTDNTFDLIKEKYQLIPIPIYFDTLVQTAPIRGVYKSKTKQELLVIDKENGKKADALNAGLSACANPFFITVDADTVVDDRGFELLVRPMFANPDAIALGASLRVRNGCKVEYNRVIADDFPRNYLSAMQSLEYMRAFILRQGWDWLKANYLISGAFAILLTQPVIKLGGFAHTVADDLEIILRLNRYMLAKGISYQIKYLPDPIAWTDAPALYKDLARQRLNWHRGLLECLWFHKSVCLNPRYGRFGLLSMPYLVYSEAIEPVFEATGIIYIIAGLLLNAVNVATLILVLASIYFFTVCFSIICILIEELTFRRFNQKRSILLLIFYCFIENFFYRPVTLIWRIRGIMDFFKKFSSIQGNSQKINESLYTLLGKEKRNEKNVGN